MKGLKKFILTLVLALTVAGTAVADTYFQSETEFYNTVSKTSKNYRNAFVIVANEGDYEGFIGETFSDNTNDLDLLGYDGKYERVFVVFTNDVEVSKTALREALADTFYYYRLFELPGEYIKMINYFKALVDCVK